MHGYYLSDKLRYTLLTCLLPHTSQRTHVLAAQSIRHMQSLRCPRMILRLNIFAAGNFWIQTKIFWWLCSKNDK